MDLNTDQQSGQQVYTINGKTYPDTEKIKVKKGRPRQSPISQ